MRDETIVQWLRSKYQSLVGDLDERGRRRWAAVEAQSLGRGGITAVAKATGLSDRTVRTGMSEIQTGVRWPEGRQRQAGGGRKAVQEKAPQLLKALESLVEPVTRGDPQSPLKWTCKSTRELSKELKKQGHLISRTTVAKLLKEAGYSLQANRKTIEGAQHPDRNAQFEHINRRVKAQQRAGQPALSAAIPGRAGTGGRTTEQEDTDNARQANRHFFLGRRHDRGRIVPCGNGLERGAGERRHHPTSGAVHGKKKEHHE